MNENKKYYEDFLKQISEITERLRGQQTVAEINNHIEILQKLLNQYDRGFATQLTLPTLYVHHFIINFQSQGLSKLIEALEMLIKEVQNLLTQLEREEVARKEKEEARQKNIAKLRQFFLTCAEHAEEIAKWWQ